MASKIPRLGAIILLLLFTLYSIDPIESKQTAFEFINHLQGCQKGQNMSGIYQLKQYLERFGYLNNASYNQANGNLYDDVLESAVKAYQQFYHLQVTGILDSETVKEMTMPRCGFPDIVNKNNHHNNKLIHAVSRYRFIQGNPRWGKYALTYTFRSSVAVPISPYLQSVCARAFQKWAQVTRFTFQEVPQNYRADIMIGFHVGSHGDNSPFDGPLGVLAHAYPPSIGQLHFDGTENWSTNPVQNNQVDLESVALHEIGHVLGLDHDDNVRDAVMFSRVTLGRTKRNLHPDDIQGIRALYGF